MSVCPNCGYCDHCKRSARPYYPYYPTYPIYPYPYYPTWITATGGNANINWQIQDNTAAAPTFQLTSNL